MKQKEMSIYLKIITIGLSVFLLAFAAWFVPVIIRENVIAASDVNIYRGICVFIAVTSIPCFLCLAHFWNICSRIGNDQSFTKENALSLKKMSQLMILDTLFYIVFLIWFCLTNWVRPLIGLFFAILMAIFICTTLAVVCIALSHLVYKASEIQEEQDLTI